MIFSRFLGLAVRIFNSVVQTLMRSMIGIARHSQNCRPRIAITASSICHLSFGLGRSLRMQLAKWRPKRLIQRRTVSRLTIWPRSASKSSTSAALRRQCQAESESPSDGERRSVVSWHLDTRNTKLKQLGNTIVTDGRREAPASDLP